MLAFYNWLSSVRFKLNSVFNTNLYYTPNERAFFRELDELMKDITRKDT
jgi:hypothetical protein